MLIHYILSFDLEGVEENQKEEIKHSLLSGLVKGSVTDRFVYQLPYTFCFTSQLAPEQVATILDRINEQIFPADRTLRYFIAEVNEQAMHTNTDAPAREAFEREMAKR